MAGGRPPFAWTDEIEAEIFERIANGESTRSICNDDWLPSWGTLNKRLASDPEFVARYARAREDQADKIFEECLTIADSQEGDVIKVDGKDSVNHDAIARAKLRIDTRKWMAGKLRPKKYGEKLDLTHGNPDGSPLTFTIRDMTKDA